MFELETITTEQCCRRHRNSLQIITLLLRVFRSGSLENSADASSFNNILRGTALSSGLYSRFVHNAVLLGVAALSLTINHYPKVMLFMYGQIPPSNARVFSINNL